MIALALSFFVTAIMYAAVGFGGGSTYNALLALVGTNYIILPSIALICNVIVVSGGTYRFSREGHLSVQRLLPWIVTSVPAAWLGGYITVSETLFVGLLGFSLLVAGLRMFLYPSPENRVEVSCKAYPIWLPIVIGAGLGLLSGMVGIGGGIFLAPILYFLHWGNAKMIAGTCSVFILVNSLSALSGHMIKLGGVDQLASIVDYWALFMAVMVGGQIGSILGARHLNQKVIYGITAVLILYVSARLLLRWWGLVLVVSLAAK